MRLFNKSLYVALFAVVFAGSAMVLSARDANADIVYVDKVCGPGVAAHGPFQVTVSYTRTGGASEDADALLSYLRSNFSGTTLACGESWEFDLVDEEFDGDSIADLLDDLDFDEEIDFMATIREIAVPGVVASYSGGCNVNLTTMAITGRAQTCTITNNLTGNTVSNENAVTMEDLLEVLQNLQLGVNVTLNNDIVNEIANEVNVSNDIILELLNQLLNSNELNNINDNLNVNENTQNQNQTNDQNVNVTTGDVLVSGAGPSGGHGGPGGPGGHGPGGGGQIKPPSAGSAGLFGSDVASVILPSLLLALIAAGGLRGATLVASKARR